MFSSLIPHFAAMKPDLKQVGWFGAGGDCLFGVLFVWFLQDFRVVFYTIIVTCPFPEYYTEDNSLVCFIGHPNYRFIVQNKVAKGWHH